MDHPNPWATQTPPPHSRRKKLLKLLLAACAAATAVVSVAVLVPVAVHRLDDAFDAPFEFYVPSQSGQSSQGGQSSVGRDVERYYTDNDDGMRRPRGKFVGCPEETREAGVWFFCEFDYPTSETPSVITCAYVNVDGALTYEMRGTRHQLRGREISRARAAVEKGAPSVCDSV